MQNIGFKAPSKNMKIDENIINVVPFVIRHSGEANVNGYFNHKVQISKGSTIIFFGWICDIEIFFRGRRKGWAEYSFEN